MTRSCTSPASPTTRASSWTRSLSTTHQLDCFEPMVMAAKKAGVKRFVYASSSSVYGVSATRPNVTEDHPLVPLTLYNKYKGMCEPLLWKHNADDFTSVDHPPGDGLRLQPAHAARPVGQHPDQPRGQQGQDHRVRRRRRCARTCISRTWSTLYELMLTAPHEKIARRDLQHRLPEPFDRRTSRRW